MCIIGNIYYTHICILTFIVTILLYMYTGFKVDSSHLHTNIILLHITTDVAPPSADLNLTDDVAAPSTDLNLAADVAVDSMTADELVAKLKEAGRCIHVKEC